MGIMELGRVEEGGRDRQQQKKRKIGELGQSNCEILLAETSFNDIIMAGAFVVMNRRFTSPHRGGQR
jgi:hypothetical protein